MSLYKQPASSIYWTSIYLPSGERVRESTGTDDRREAQRIHDERKALAWKQSPGRKGKGKTWGDAVNAWLDVQERSDSELLSLAKFAKFFPDRPLTRVRPDDVEEALNRFTKTAGTYTRYRTMINAILRLSGVELQIKSKKDKRPNTRDWITPEHWKKLHDELPRHLRPPAQFAVSTGLRQANVLRLRWDHVDLNRRHVWTDAVDSKSGQPIATPLNDDAIAALEAVKGQDPVWCFTYRGKPFKEIKTAFMAACIRAGVPDFTWHGFRHTWATWHVQNGTPLEVLRILGGWSDLRMVVRYAHHSPSFVASYVDNVKLTEG